MKIDKMMRIGIIDGIETDTGYNIQELAAILANFHKDNSSKWRQKY